MKFLKICLGLSLLFITSRSGAEAYKPQFTLSLDLLGHEAFAPKSGLDSSSGFGGSLFLEWRPMPFMSFGTYADYITYSANGGWQTSALDLGGRLYPFPSDKGGEFYLQGSMGVNLIAHSMANRWPAYWNGSAGMGYKAYVDKNNALDFGVQYDLYSPPDFPIHSVGVKLGWTFLFGDTPVRDLEKPSSKPAPVSSKGSAVKASPAATTLAPATSDKPKHSKAKKKHNNKKKPAPVSAAPAGKTYTWVAGDQLESLAEAYFGRGNLYPLIVDANKETLKSPAGLVAGVVLKIPENPSEADKAGARAKAEFTEYLQWAKVGKPY